MDWRERTDLWRGTLLLRPAAHSANEAHGGAFVAFVVVADGIQVALDVLIRTLDQEGWQLTSIERMKRAWDYMNDPDDTTESGLNFNEMVEEADQHGVSLGAFHTFPRQGQQTS